VTGVIVVTIGGGFEVQAQDLVRVCARAERESQARQNKYSHHLGVHAEWSLMRLSVLNHAQSKGIYNCKFTDATCASKLVVRDKRGTVPSSVASVYSLGGAVFLENTSTDSATPGIWSGIAGSNLSPISSSFWR
jgi:hypothetical protein